MDRSSKVKEAMLHFYDHASTGNVHGIENLFTRQPGLIGIGTDPKEYWVGYETCVRMMRTQIQELGGQMPIKAGDIQALAEGTVGWVADRATCPLPDGSSIPLRITAVFHQEGSEWKMVQLHCSVGAANADVLGKELTTS